MWHYWRRNRRRTERNRETIKKNIQQSTGISYELTVVATEVVVEMVAELTFAHSSGCFFLDSLGYQILKMVSVSAGYLVWEVVAVAVTFHPILPSSSNILHRSWLDCCFLRFRPFQDAFVCNLSLCVRLHLVVYS